MLGVRRGALLERRDERETLNGHAAFGRGYPDGVFTGIGCQSGVIAWWPMGTGAWSVPSAFIVYSTLPPSRAVMNAILVPSGDHAGSLSEATSVVKRWSEPSGCRTYTSRFPLTVRESAMRDPSGDQVTAASDCSRNSVHGSSMIRH